MEIKLEKISYFDKLNRISYTFEEEKITSIIGSSGSGKTLLTYLILGLIKPTNGQVINNYNLKDIGYLFQNPKDMFFNKTVYEEIAFSLKKYNYKLDILNKHISDSLKMIGLNDSYLQRDPFTLSSGEQVKLALAIIISLNPKVLIIDEPTSYLDNKSIKDLVYLLKKLKRDYHKTIILVSNNINFVYEISDNIILLNKGKIILEGKKDIIINNYPKIKKGGMEIPKILEFISLVEKKKNIRLAKTENIKELMKDIYRNV